MHFIITTIIFDFFKHEIFNFRLIFKIQGKLFFRIENADRLSNN